MEIWDARLTQECEGPEGHAPWFTPDLNIVNHYRDTGPRRCPDGHAMNAQIFIQLNYKVSQGIPDA